MVTKFDNNIIFVYPSRCSLITDLKAVKKLSLHLWDHSLIKQLYTLDACSRPALQVLPHEAIS
jgi:hypothetical protein